MPISDLERLGFTRSAIRHRVEAGRWRRVTREVIAIGPEVAGVRAWLRAAIFTLPDAIVSHEAAGELHGLRHVPRDRPTVTVPVQAAHACGVVTVRRSDDIRSSHRTEVGGFPVTTVARTVVDLAAVLRLRELEQIVDGVLSDRRTTHPEIRQVHEQVARRGKPGVAAMRDLLDEREREPGMGFSELERRFMRLLRDADLELPISQATVPWLSPWERVDFAYPDHRLAVEVDGAAFHLDQEAWERDRRRDQAAAAAGWQVLRFTWRQVVRDEVGTIATLRAVLEPTARQVS